MAQFEIVKKQELKMVKVTLNREQIRAESGALHYMQGRIEMESQMPSAAGFFKSFVTGENVFKPVYSGSGEIFFGPP
ncbi:MAG TPA: AIM24 family protein, partial [Candidatus Wallbacteria bacterium]|nr:AIM24 family protein [Candidatus Wallbacteria bacterium]